MDLLINFNRDYLKAPRPVIALLAKNPLALALYLVLLGRARYTPGLGQLAHGLVDLEIGEAVAGRAELAAECATSENKVRTALDHLQRLRLITIKTTNRGSKVTICGYAESLGGTRGESPARTPAKSPAPAPQDHQQTTSQTTTNKILRSEIRDQDLGEARKQARGHRVAPSDWQPRTEDALLQPEHLARELAKFRDHEFPRAHTEWDRAWRNWQRRAAESAPRSGSYAPPRRNSPTETALEMLAEAEERERLGARPVDPFGADVPHAAEVLSLPAQTGGAA